MARRPMHVKRQLRTTSHVVEALDGRVPFEDVDAVINALWWDETTTVRPNDPDGHGPFGRRRIVDDRELERVRDTLEIVAEHLRARDEMNACLHMAKVRESPLTTAAAGARDRVRELLQDPEDD